MKDIYFENEYGKLYENVPEDKFEVFEYEDEIGKISNRFIKRQIPISLDNDVVYYDLATPYGYGGPVIEYINDNSKKNQLVKKFKEEYIKYTEDENIVSEFVRFHPIINNAEDFKKIYDVIFNRKTVGTDLRFDDPFGSEFSKSTRKTIRKLLRNDHISYQVIDNPNSLDDFMKIYYSTMDRNNADVGYYFEESYFKKMLSSFQKNIVAIKVYYDDEVIGMSINFKSNKFLHAHLSGTLREYLDYSPAYILKYALMEYGKTNNYEFVHYGGGASSSEHDSLFRFKNKFGKNTKFDFYLGKKIWNKNVYDKLCLITKNEEVKDFFPAYRKQ